MEAMESRPTRGGNRSKSASETETVPPCVNIAAAYDAASPGARGLGALDIVGMLRTCTHRPRISLHRIHTGRPHVRGRLHGQRHAARSRRVHTGDSRMLALVGSIVCRPRQTMTATTRPKRVKTEVLWRWLRRTGAEPAAAWVVRQPSWCARCPAASSSTTFSTAPRRRRCRRMKHHSAASAPSRVVQISTISSGTTHGSRCGLPGGLTGAAAGETAAGSGTGGGLGVNAPHRVAEAGVGSGMRLERFPGCGGGSSTNGGHESGTGRVAGRT